MFWDGGFNVDYSESEKPWVTSPDEVFSVVYIRQCSCPTGCSCPADDEGTCDSSINWGKRWSQRGFCRFWQTLWEHVSTLPSGEGGPGPHGFRSAGSLVSCSVSFFYCFLFIYLFFKVLFLTFVSSSLGCIFSQPRPAEASAHCSHFKWITMPTQFWRIILLRLELDSLSAENIDFGFSDSLKNVCPLFRFVVKCSLLLVNSYLTQTKAVQMKE